MRFGMNMLLWNLDCTGPKFPPLFERLKAMGFDLVEIPIFTTDSKRLARVAKQLDAMGLERTAVTCLGARHNMIGKSPRVRAAAIGQVRRVIDCCHAMGVTRLSGPLQAALGVFSGRGPTRQEWRWAVEGLDSVARYAEQAGVTLALEFLNRFEIYLGTSVDEMIRMIREIDRPNVRMMYDTFHAHIEEKNVRESLERCGDLLTQVHVSESDRSTPGQGGVDWSNTWGGLRTIGFQGDLVIEAFGQGLPAMAAATKIWRKMFSDEETLAREGLAFMKQSWAN